MPSSSTHTEKIYMITVNSKL